LSGGSPYVGRMERGHTVSPLSTLGAAGKWDRGSSGVGAVAVGIGGAVPLQKFRPRDIRNIASIDHCGACVANGHSVNAFAEKRLFDHQVVLQDSSDAGWSRGDPISRSSTPQAPWLSTRVSRRSAARSHARRESVNVTRSPSPIATNPITTYVKRTNPSALHSSLPTPW
jgi:hypothetical protein